jgi:hypothetical protein
LRRKFRSLRFYTASGESPRWLTSAERTLCRVVGIPRSGDLGGPLPEPMARIDGPPSATEDYGDMHNGQSLMTQRSRRDFLRRLKVLLKWAALVLVAALAATFSAVAIDMLVTGHGLVEALGTAWLFVLTIISAPLALLSGQPLFNVYP